MDGAHELEVAHTVRTSIIGEPSSNTFANTREKMEEVAQRLNIFGARRFEDPGTMDLEETIGVVRSLVKWKRRNKQNIKDDVDMENTRHENQKMDTGIDVENDIRIRD